MLKFKLDKYVGICNCIKFSSSKMGTKKILIALKR